MPTNYPTSIDTFAANGTNLGSTPTHASMHTNVQDAVRAVQNELGANPSLGYATVAALLTDLTTLGVKGYAQNTASQTGITTVADLTSLSVTFNAVPARRYRVTLRLEVTGNIANDLAIAYIASGANAAYSRAIAVMPPLTGGTSYKLINNVVILTGLSGSQTVKGRLERNTGTGTLNMFANATNPAFILVEDIGAF